jgi:peptidylprolyl isomerase
MKKSVLAYVSLFLLAPCCCAKNLDANQVEQAGIKKVTKQKSSSGLEYETLQEGVGGMPKAGQKVTVHYTGWLDYKGEPGIKFDSSVDRGQPFVFNIGVGRVIKGWDEGVATMRIGEKRRLFIPSHLGYGASGAAGGKIPAHANLIFDVELLKVD